MNTQINTAPMDSAGVTRTRILVALAFVALYIGVKLWLLNLVDDNVEDREWGRYVYLAGGLESVVTIAIGWLFGREVHRKAFQEASQAATHSREMERKARDAADQLHKDHTTALQRAE